MSALSRPSDRAAQAPRRRRNLTRALAGAVAIAAASGTVLLAQQQQPGADDKGKARVVERRGPEVEVRSSGVGQVVVLFPQTVSGERNVVELTMVESQLPAPAQPGQPAQGSAMPTGREFVFSSKDARDQTVSYKLDASGNGRKLMLLAKIDGKMAEVRQAGGSEGVQMYTVAMPEVPKPAAEAAAPAADGQPAAPAAPPAPPAQAAVIVFYTGTVTQ